jgi:CRP/FNR family transcriptional regulator, cyclic AMP receptor protein
MIPDIRNISIFKNLDQTQLQQISSLLYFRSFSAAKNIFLEQTPGDTVFFIIKGKVKITRYFRDGSEAILDIIGDGEIFGEMSLIDSLSRSASVITLENSSLCWMGKIPFQNCIKLMPVLAMNLMATLTNRLRRSNEKFCAYSKLDVAGMVAWSLLDLVEIYACQQEPGEFIIPFRLTQGDLASLAMASRERVNHVIGQFKREKIIVVDANYQITVIKKEALEKLVVL